MEKEGIYIEIESFCLVRIKLRVIKNKTFLKIMTEEIIMHMMGDTLKTEFLVKSKKKGKVSFFVIYLIKYVRI